MRWTPEQLAEYEARRQEKQPIPQEGIDSESKLHESIIDYCNSQWPRWKFIRARMDKRSTIQTGAQDFTIFMPASRMICVECKRRDGKLSTDQHAWALEMQKLGHPVHVVRSFDEFLTLVDSILYPNQGKLHD